MLTNCVFIHLDVYFIYNYLVSMKLKAKESEEILLNHLENELIVQQVRYITWLRKNINKFLPKIFCGELGTNIEYEESSIELLKSIL